MLYNTLGAALAAAYLVPYKAAVTQVGPERLVLPMLLVAAALNTVPDLWQQVRARRRKSWSWSKVTLLMALLLGAASALGNEAVCQALVWVNPGLVSVLLRTQVIFVALGALVVLREPLGARFWIGVALALGGYLLLRSSTGLAGDVAVLGLGWAVAAAAAFGSMQVVVRKWIAQVDPLQVNTLRLWLAAALVALLPGRVAALSSLDGHIWLLAGVAALCGPVLSRLCLMAALRYLPAAHATLALFVAPVFAYLGAGLAFSSWPGIWEILGGLTIIIAVTIPVGEISADRQGKPAAER